MSHTIQAQRSQTPMWVYEKNFVLLYALFPELDSADYIKFSPELLGLCFTFQVHERCRYTSMLELRLKLNLPERCMQELVMKIRVYADAQMVEVTGYKGIGRLLPRYSYPNKKMLLKDEKHQANILLHDWLSLALAHNLKKNQEYA